MPMPSGAYSSQERIPEGYEKFKINNYTPEQEKLSKSQYEHVGPNSYLSQLASGEGSAYESMEQSALRKFGDVQAGIASKFSGAGIGSRNSSGFANAQNTAASDFLKDLQAKRYEMRRNAIMDLMGITNNILNQRQYETGLVGPQEEQSSGWGGIIGAVGGGIAGTFVGNPMLGATLGYSLGSQF